MQSKSGSERIDVLTSAQLRATHVSRLRLGTVTDAKLVMGFFVFLLVLSALDAYDIGRLPVQWIMQLASIAGIGFIAVRQKLFNPLGYRILWLVLFWSALVTGFSTVFGHYASLMPAGATTPYPLFIALRLLTLLFFIASLYLIYWLVRQGYRDPLVKATVLVATLVSIAALYIYFAQIYGWPQPPRTRLGTSGAAQVSNFTYEFRRATGTFREPSLLAAWLIVPFFLCFAIRGRFAYAQAILIGGTLLLTGSLSGILAVTLGLVVTAVTAFWYGARSLRTVARALGAGLGVAVSALAIFYLLAVSNTNHRVNLFATIGDRIGPILKGGLGQSDRNHVYDYVVHTIPPLFGAGLGNANLLLGQFMGTPVVAGFLSLYLNILYSVGLVGLAILMWFVVFPLYKIATNRDLRRDSRVLLMVGAYLAWLVVFAVAIEELTFMFALISALLAYAIFNRSKSAASAREAVRR